MVFLCLCSLSLSLLEPSYQFVTTALGLQLRKRTSLSQIELKLIFAELPGAIAGLNKHSMGVEHS